MAIRAEVLNQWKNALLSGEYEQGKRKLYNDRDNTYCCLGVLCHLYIKEINPEFKFNEKNLISELDFNIPGCSGGINTSYLPIEVTEWAKISESFQGTLSSVNDSTEGNFELIANNLEKYLKDN